MAELLNAIIARGGTTAHQRPFDAERMRAHYIAPALGISCHLAEVGGRLAGFQALEWCDPDWQGPGKLPADWAVVASFVAEEARGRGVGRALWDATRDAADAAGVKTVDATIRADNAEGLAFYSGLGFADYRVVPDVPLRDGTRVDRVCKRFDLPRG
ncbi:MAG: GNAT family N-acetyltransferase [Paracoccaceae bacterium]